MKQGITRCFTFHRQRNTQYDANNNNNNNKSQNKKGTAAKRGENVNSYIRGVIDRGRL